MQEGSSPRWAERYLHSGYLALSWPFGVLVPLRFFLGGGLSSLCFGQWPVEWRVALYLYKGQFC